MRENHDRNDRVLFWVSAALTVTVLASTIADECRKGQWSFATHELSKYRDIEYPFTIDVYGYKY